jgi:hypothetical protein
MSEDFRIDVAILTAEELLEEAIADDIKAGRLLEVAQVAKRIKRNPETIREYIRRQQLKACRAGRGHYLITEAALSYFLSAQVSTT